MEETGEIQGIERSSHGTAMKDYRPQALTLLLKTGRFLLHFGEMCIVMCLSLGIFTHLAVAVGSLAGYSDAVRQFPVLAVGLLSIWFALAMIGWMQLRGHEWRMTLEMASTSLFAAVPLIAGALLGFIPSRGLTGLECGLACVFMVIAMLIRLDHFTGSHASHAQYVHAPQPGV